MAISKELLSLMGFMDKTGDSASELMDYADSARQDSCTVGFPLPERTEEDRRGLEGTRRLIERVVKARSEPDRGVTDAVNEWVVNVMGQEYEEYVEHALVRLQLEAVSDTVSRWMKLKALSLVGLPEDRVRNYLRQAVACYLNGLPNAAAILCRTVIEFALIERLSMLGGVNQLRLGKLIERAASAGILSEAQQERAERVRVLGNEAVHKQNISEMDALCQLQDTLAVLEGLYHRPREG